jgi:hypothetical protein
MDYQLLEVDWIGRTHVMVSSFTLIKSNGTLQVSHYPQNVLQDAVKILYGTSHKLEQGQATRYVSCRQLHNG